MTTLKTFNLAAARKIAKMSADDVSANPLPELRKLVNRAHELTKTTKQPVQSKTDAALQLIKLSKAYVKSKQAVATPKQRAKKTILGMVSFDSSAPVKISTSKISDWRKAEKIILNRELTESEKIFWLSKTDADIRVEIV